MKLQRKIGIVGYGYVGKAMHALFRGHYEVLIYDVAPQPGFKYATQAQINECDLAVVCVPTPENKDGSCDTRIVEKTIEWLETPLILIKSTVSIGTTDRLTEKTGKNLVFSPEYCGESSYWTPYTFHSDIKATPFFIFGGPAACTSKIVDIFLPITGPVKTYRQTTALAAELAKYMENTFYATKIAFCYELAHICEAAGADFNEVRELWLLDPRINPMHTAVFAGNASPFSGKCLPKDLSALIETAKKLQYKPELLEEVRRSNQRLATLRTARTNPQQKKSKKAA